MEDFFQMGGYANFIWPAYILVALVMVGLWATSYLSHRQSVNKLASLERETRHLRSGSTHET